MIPACQLADTPIRHGGTNELFILILLTASNLRRANYCWILGERMEKINSLSAFKVYLVVSEKL